MKPTEVWVRHCQASAAKVVLCPAAASQGQDAAEAGGEEGSRQQGSSLLRSLHTVGWDAMTQKASNKLLTEAQVAAQAGELPASVSRLLSFSITL